MGVSGRGRQGRPSWGGRRSKQRVCRDGMRLRLPPQPMVVASDYIPCHDRAVITSSITYHSPLRSHFAI
jgi:hypothetical protein